MLEQKIRDKIKGWRMKAEQLDEQRLMLEQGRYSSSLDTEEKRQWNGIRDEAGNLRHYANELEELLLQCQKKSQP
jgi:hypothetical protein